MKSRYAVKLGGVDMASTNENLLVLDVLYDPLKPNRNEYSTVNLDGIDYTLNTVDVQTIVVQFELHIYDIKKRSDACQAVNAWASAGGNLVINDRNGQYLTVVCTQYASITSARNWTDPLTIVFQSTYIPYWQSTTAKSLSLSGKSAKGTLKLDGNVGSALVYVEVTVAEKLTSFDISCGNTKIMLKSISVEAGGRIEISYLRNRYLRIRATNASGNLASIISALQPASSDNLLAVCGGSTAVSYSANGKVTVKVSARGMWL